MADLASTAAALVAPGKGILAADESPATMSARLAAAGVRPTVANRRAYRELLISTPAVATGVSGVILRAETFGQQLAGNGSFPDVLMRAGLLPGIRVDAGPVPLAGCPGETATEGQDGLQARLVEFASQGAAFAKWRAMLRIGPGMPSGVAILANAHALGRYAAACQHAGLVPVIEPEILSEGAHSLAQCQVVMSLVLLETIAALQDYRVELDGAVLSPAMALPGTLSGEPVSPGEIATATIAALAGVPATLGGIAFVSGPQSPVQATASLAALQVPMRARALTFCFGSALAGPALAAWRGRRRCVLAGQQALTHRIAMNVAALHGRYTPAREASGTTAGAAP